LRNLIHNSNYQLVVYIHYVVFDIYDVSCVWKASQNTSTYGVLDKIQRQQSEETKAALSCLDIFCFQSIKYFLLSGMAVGARLVVLDNRHRSRPSDSSDGVWPVLPSHNSNTISDTGFSGSSQGIEDSHWARWQATRSQQSCSGVSPAAIPERAPVKSSPAKRTVTWLDLHQAQAQGSLATEEDCDAVTQAGLDSGHRHVSGGSGGMSAHTRRRLHARSHTHNWSRQYRESRLGVRSLEFYVIDPRHSFQRRWDVLTIFLLFAVALRVPYEVVFLTERVDGMFWVNRLVDVIFLVDIVLNFFLAYFDRVEGMWMFNPKKIRARYLSGWFIVDVTALSPLHWVVPLLGKELTHQFVVGGIDILKLSQACKLLRVLRFPRILKRLETSYNFNFIQMELIKFFLKTCILGHWVACLFGAFDSFEPGDVTWLSSYLCPEDTWNSSCQREHFTPYTRYLAGLYWTVATLTTIGFGDVVVETDNERVVSVIVMLFGAFQYGYIIGMLANLLATRDEGRNRYIQMMTELNLFMAESKMPMHIQEKLREYFKFRMSAPNLKGYHNILDAMSPWLRREVSVFHDGNWIKQVELLKDTPEQFLVEVALNITQQTYPPFETIYEKGDKVEQMSIIKKGLVDCGGTICRKFQILAEECLYKEWIQEAHVMTMTFVELWSVDCKTLSHIIGQFPEVRRVIRFNAIRRIFRQEIFAYELPFALLI